MHNHTRTLVTYHEGLSQADEPRGSAASADADSDPRDMSQAEDTPKIFGKARFGR